MPASCDFGVTLASLLEYVEVAAKRCVNLAARSKRSLNPPHPRESCSEVADVYQILKTELMTLGSYTGVVLTAWRREEECIVP